jgi:hypothetical protein
VKFRARFVLLTSQKQVIMKVARNLFIVAIFGMGLFASCTPESIEDGQTPQQVDNQLRPPRQG